MIPAIALSVIETGPLNVFPPLLACTLPVEGMTIFKLSLKTEPFKNTLVHLALTFVLIVDPAKV
ncbi:MAG: hypothetical protein BWY67_02523 [Bacteroidetes bacterium ADurb.Bin397]|nr:MAG: hypothetical protein BWY67_02523 [Bacteroidetes bacterium ADurb.Bin397]